MPYTNWHAARMRDPDDFIKDSFVTLKLGGDKTGILLISGKLKGGDNKLVEQAYRFRMDKWSVEEAKKWLKDHKKKPISFEPGVKPEKSFDYNDFKFDGEISEDDLKNYEDINYNIDNNLSANIEHKTFAIELSEVKKLTIDDDEKGVFIGAMASEAKDRGNDIIASGAFDRTLANYRKAKRNIKLFYQHDTKELPIGIISFKNIEKDNKNWVIKGELNLNTQRGAEVYSLMKQGALSDLSIGFSVVDQEFKKDTRIIKDLDLWEVSVVSEPMNQKAKIEEVKMDENIVKKFEIADVENITSRAEFNKILRKSGVFSNAACEFLASCFVLKQSKSVTGDIDAIKKALIEIKNLIEKM